MARENVLYILGAGFSAPLGIPTMKHFLSKAKDLYAHKGNEYPHFDGVFKELHHLSTVKNYLESDLFNLEEVLSILEMKSFVHSEDLAEDFRKFIADVIQHYTPPLPNQPTSFRDDWGQQLLGTGPYGGYFSFVSNLCNLKFTAKPTDENFLMPEGIAEGSDLRYGIISLNYDMVIENCVEYLNRFLVNEKIKLKSQFDGEDCYRESQTLSIAKIHGTVKPLDGEDCYRDNIIPPTWNKTRPEKTTKIWQLANELIKNANHIRFLGYSLPESDNHLKYLLKTGIVDSELRNLKTVHVLCRDDPARSVEGRFQSLILPRFLTFKNTNISDYFGKIADLIRLSNAIRHQPQFILNCNKLEESHNHFFPKQL